MGSHKENHGGNEMCDLKNAKAVASLYTAHFNRRKIVGISLRLLGYKHPKYDNSAYLLLKLIVCYRIWHRDVLFHSCCYRLRFVCLTLAAMKRAPFTTLIHQAWDKKEN